MTQSNYDRDEDILSYHDCGKDSSTLNFCDWCKKNSIARGSQICDGWCKRIILEYDRDGNDYEIKDDAQYCGKCAAKFEEVKGKVYCPSCVVHATEPEDKM